ncbi:MAG TPA: hypothetical protein DF383_11605 [Deltaproteobacteria bacterium]|nr:hypothetical protein [Deltaproteobacteria bacterium]
MELFNAPNSLTLLRIFLIPVFTWYFLQGEYRLALAIFIATGLTDVIDGALARALKKQSALGTILDPAADKLLMLVTFIVLAMRNLVPVWLSVLVIVRDLWIVLGSLVLKKLKKRLSIHPTRLSKLNTFFQLFTICLAFFLTVLRSESPPKWLGYEPKIAWLLDRVIYVVAGMTVLTGIQYTRIGWRMLVENETRH